MSEPIVYGLDIDLQFLRQDVLVDIIVVECPSEKVQIPLRGIGYDIFLIQFYVDYLIIIALWHLHAELHMITDLLECTMKSGQLDIVYLEPMIYIGFGHTDLLGELRFCPVHCLDEPVKKLEVRNLRLRNAFQVVLANASRHILLLLL